jgi:hypothetical protein
MAETHKPTATRHKAAEADDAPHALSDVPPGAEAVAPAAAAAPAPGWSNAPEDHGIASLIGPAGSIDMSQPGWSNNGPPATGATAGTPGTWTPALSDTPNSLGAMAGTVTASPATAWTTGQSVLLGDGTSAYWNRTAWVAGTAP